MYGGEHLDDLAGMMRLRATSNMLMTFRLMDLRFV